MAAMRMIIVVIGILAVAMGALWIGQGYGFIRWPADSFMIADMTWAGRGAMLAAAGVLMIIGSRWLGRSEG